MSFRWLSLFLVPSLVGCKKNCTERPVVEGHDLQAKEEIQWAVDKFYDRLTQPLCVPKLQLKEFEEGKGGDYSLLSQGIRIDPDTDYQSGARSVSHPQTDE